jgi:DNA-binding CsgD family transcriptional regulator
MTNAEIATKLHVSRETVKSELKRIFRKIGVGNRTQAAVLLVKNHWL